MQRKSYENLKIDEFPRVIGLLKFWNIETVWKASKEGVFFWSRYGKIQSDKAPYLDIFQAVWYQRSTQNYYHFW